MTAPPVDPPLAPAAKEIDPPTPAAEAPTATLTSPDAPAAAAPVFNAKLPLFPPTLEPEESRASPLFPSLPSTLADARKILPLAPTLLLANLVHWMVVRFHFKVEKA